jgi:sulfate/thiosulfate transport system substrate-binding protein
MRRMKPAWVIGVLALVLVGAAGGATRGTKLSLVAYSTPQAAFAKIIPAFQGTSAGKDVDFSQSYGASGDQARAVIGGLSADVVDLSLQPDMTDLVNAGIVGRDWNANKFHGFVTDSVVVFVLRDGNPKKIRSWDDLTKKGVDVITPNPFTSGGARWNVMAAYGAFLKETKSPAKAVAKLTALFRNVSVQDKSARNALNTFLGGKGDVLLTYENEAILAQQNKQSVQYVIPKATILIENPLAVTKKAPAEAKAFRDFLFTTTAQRLFAQTGYRPVVKSVAKEFKFPSRPDLFTIRTLGGWKKVQPQFFDPKTGIMADVERKVGGVTG